MNIFQVFLLSVLSLYLGANAYVITHLRRAFPRHRGRLTLLWSLCALAYPLGRILREYTSCRTVFLMLFFGGIFLAFLIYSLFWCVLWDLFRGFRRCRQHAPPSEALRQRFWLTALLFTGLLLGWGYRNAAHIRIKHLELSAFSPGVTAPRTLTLAFLSDLHAGKIVAEKRLANMVRILGEIEPDCILLGGDVLENGPGTGDAIGFPQTVEAMKSLAPLGVYGITGNHEYYEGAQEITEYFRSLGITMLRDQAVLVDSAFVLAGRNDRRGVPFGDTRKPLSVILKTLPEELHGYPLIVLDHTPTKESFEASQQSGAALQLSGHTHHGQLFPFNFITEALFATSWGTRKEGETLLCVSSGAGTWGPPIRTNSVSEIVAIRLLLKPKKASP